MLWAALYSVGMGPYPVRGCCSSGLLWKSVTPFLSAGEKQDEEEGPAALWSQMGAAADSRLGIGCEANRSQSGRGEVMSRSLLQGPAGERASGEAGDPTVPGWQWAALCARAD